MTWIDSVWRYRQLPDVQVVVVETKDYNTHLVIRYRHKDKTFNTIHSADQDRFMAHFIEVKS